MISTRSKRGISAAVFGLGSLAGLCGCFGASRGIFTIGENDCLPEILAITFAAVTPLPACVIALWKRLLPGMWLIFAGCFFPYGMLSERAYMIAVRHFYDQPTVAQTVGFSLPFTLVLAAFGAFAIVTHVLKWPEVLGSSLIDDE